MGNKASMWGDWLPKMVAEMNAVELTSDEKAILQQASKIEESHRQRIAEICRKFGVAAHQN